MWMIQNSSENAITHYSNAETLGSINCVQEKIELSFYFVVQLKIEDTLWGKKSSWPFS